MREKHAGRKIYIPIGSQFSRVWGTLALCTVATKSLATHVHTRSTLSRSPRRSQPVGRRPSHRFRETEPAAAAAAAAAERDYGVSSAAADDGDGSQQPTEELWHLFILGLGRDNHTQGEE